MNPTAFLTVLTLLLLSAFPRFAAAQDDAARAVELITLGNQAYAAGDFRDALGKYRDAYGIDDNPRLLYRIGLAYENLANYQSAREHLELYLLAEPNSNFAARIRSKIASLRRLEATLQSYVRVVSIPPGASVWLNTDEGRPAGVTPVRLPVGPGTHELVVRKAGREPARQTIIVESAKTADARFELESDETSPESRASQTESPTRAAVETSVQVEPVFTGEATLVRLGPSSNVAVLSWVAIGVGWAIISLSAADAAIGLTRQVAVFSSGFLIGAGLASAGAYFLWVKDYTNELPRVPDSATAPPPGRSIGITVRF